VLVLVYLHSLGDMYTVTLKWLSGNNDNITDEDTYHSDFPFLHDITSRNAFITCVCYSIDKFISPILTRVTVNWVHIIIPFTNCISISIYKENVLCCRERAHFMWHVPKA
jgi:hypothetical protein